MFEKAKKELNSMILPANSFEEFLTNLNNLKASLTSWFYNKFMKYK